MRQLALVADADRINRAATGAGAADSDAGANGAAAARSVGAAASVHSDDTPGSTVADDEASASAGADGDADGKADGNLHATGAAASAAAASASAALAACRGAVLRLGASLQLHDDERCRRVLATRGSATCSRVNNPKASGGGGGSNLARLPTLSPSRHPHSSSLPPRRPRANRHRAQPPRAVRPLSAGAARRSGGGAHGSGTRCAPPWALGSEGRPPWAPAETAAPGQALGDPAAAAAHRAARRRLAHPPEHTEAPSGPAKGGGERASVGCEEAGWKPGQPAIPRPWERHFLGAAESSSRAEKVLWVAGAVGSKEWAKLYGKLSDQTLGQSATGSDGDGKLVRLAFPRLWIAVTHTYWFLFPTAKSPLALTA